MLPRVLVPLLAISLVLSFTAADAGGGGTRALSTKTVVLLDSSSTMADRTASGRTKSEISASVLVAWTGELSIHSYLGLVLFGRTGENGCRDVEAAVPAEILARKHIMRELALLRPGGKAPTLGAIETGLELLGDAGSLVLISDSKDSCTASPCHTLAELLRERPSITLHVIAFGATDEERTELSCFAHAGRGRFYTASNALELAFAVRAATDTLPVATSSVPPESSTSLARADSGALYTGGSVAVRFSGREPTDPSAWAEVVAKHATAPTDQASRRYLLDQRDGMLELPLPGVPGEYEVHVHERDQESPAPITVAVEASPVRLTLDADSVSAGTPLCVQYEASRALPAAAWFEVYADGQERSEPLLASPRLERRPWGTWTFPTPRTAGVYHLTLRGEAPEDATFAKRSFRVERIDARLRLTRRLYDAGELFEVSYLTTAPLGAHPSIELARKDSLRGDAPVAPHRVLSRSPIAPGSRRGHVAFDAPTEPGHYSLTLRDEDDAGGLAQLLIEVRARGNKSVDRVK